MTMKAKHKGVLTGTHYMDGDHAACEGALAAGCRFVAGYPITPSTEIVERFAARIPHVGGIFMQMEDEIASSIAIQGAVWGGAKAMTVTSGPGFSLMMEHIGYAVMTETPCVFVDVQRGGPSTGLPTLPAQSDMMQARWGSHGDYEIIALCPNSPQECFDLIIKAFDLAERFRTPVMFMMDECVGHMTEKVIIPEADDISLYNRRYTKKPVSEFKICEPLDDLVPEMAALGQGYNFHITGLTHDESGYPAMDVNSQHRLIRRFIDKIVNYKDEIIMMENDHLDDADVIVVSYGITSRVSKISSTLWTVPPICGTLITLQLPFTARSTSLTICPAFISGTIMLFTFLEILKKNSSAKGHIVLSLTLPFLAAGILCFIATRY